MNPIDIIILVFIGIGTVWGMTKGFVRQLSSLVGLVVGLLVARALFAEVGDWVAPGILHVMDYCTDSVLALCLVPDEGPAGGTPRVGKPLVGRWYGSHQVHAPHRYGRTTVGIRGCETRVDP